MKAIFFDIDGTLTDQMGVMPPSAKRALDLARERGHKLFLCTGRNRKQIDPALADYGFDGVISAAGASVFCQGEEIYHRYVDPDPLDRCIDYFEGRPLIFELQTASGNFIDRCSYRYLEDKLKQVPMGDKILEKVTQGMRVEDSLRGHSDVQKFIYFDCPEDVEDVQRALGEYFLVLASSLPIPEKVRGTGEITIRGVMKSTGIREAIRYFGISREDTVAFGDGENDIDMLEYAAVGVAMGNAGEEVKAAADLVTAEIDRDGIYLAMEKLGLIS